MSQPDNTNGVPQKYVDAAKKYCVLAGIDPEQPIGHSPEANQNGIVYAVLIYSPRWMLVARDLREHDLRNQSLLP